MAANAKLNNRRRMTRTPSRAMVPRPPFHGGGWDENYVKSAKFAVCIWNIGYSGRQLKGKWIFCRIC